MKDKALARHILESISRIQQFTKGISEEHFKANYMVQDAVIRNLEVIGEAARSITSETKALYPAIPWRQVTAMRNFLIHEYFAVDIEAVWNVVELDLDNLRQQMTVIANA